MATCTESPSTSNSSRVKVEFTDPAGVYPLISVDLNSRLPLRNLYWKSASRPVRSIDSLYVELVPDESLLSGRTTTADNATTQSGPPDARRGSQAFPPKKERRHQIPGLRQTPYLKVYLLRCDDSDTYKSSTRKLLREWIKAHTPPSQSSTTLNSQENHDAFEWMIIHLVLPDVQHGSVWPSKSSNSVLDKIRSDFNGSSKSGVDRVAQIPATRSLQVQGATVNPVPSGAARDEFLQETNRAWDDLLMKLKALILTSFDLRVSQYEEDIKERISQRALPGWNFCTFFVLKEGLARGFESVGLVEDALAGYDELSAELHAAVDEERAKVADGQVAGLFRDHTAELLDMAESAEAEAQGSSAKALNAEEPSLSLLNADRKQYRELILANNISAFDFQSYVFARQMSLLSRIARLMRTTSSTGDSDSENLMTLAEMCRRAVLFITAAGRIIREDLRASFKVKQDADGASMSVRYTVIENIVSSWTYSSCQQILSRTSPKSLIQQLQSLPPGPGKLPSSLPPNSPPPERASNDLSAVRPRSLPRRISSLIGRKMSSAVSPSFDNILDLANAQKSPLLTETQTGFHVLAGQRAELYLVARRAFSGLGQRHGWRVTWVGFAADQEEVLDEVSLDQEPGQRSSADPYHPTTDAQLSAMYGVQDDTLRTALSSRNSFYSAYEDMTNAVCDHYKLSGNNKSVEAMISDIALVRYYLEDYAAAASYFHQLAPYYAQDDWANLELSILDMYAQCLKKLDRWDDFVKIGLKVLAKTVQLRHQSLGLKSKLGIKSTAAMYSNDAVNGARYLADVLGVSRKLKEPVTAPMVNYLGQLQVDTYIRHFEDQDGFELSLSLCNMMPSELYVQQVQLRLVSTRDGLARDIWLSTDSATNLHRGLVAVVLASNVVIPDWYLVDQITIRAENIMFTHGFLPANSSQLFAGSRTSVSSDGSGATGPRILVWPAHRSFQLRVSLYADIHLEQPRSILCELSSGRNAISGGKLYIRAGTAGLRLHTANARLVAGGGKISDVSQPGLICFEQVPENSIIKIRVPYRLESEMKEISLRTEVTYTTPQGEFVSGDGHTLSVILPLGVNVHDVFKQGALFSKFSISSSTSIPLRLVDCQIEGTEDFEATSPRMETTGLCMFAKQPISMVYKITRTAKASRSGKALQSKLSMQIRYLCLDDEVLATVRRSFLESLQVCEFSPLSRLLIPSLMAILRAKLLAQDLEMVGLLREVGMGTFESFRWEQLLVALPLGVRARLTSWLRQWHKDHVTVSLPSNLDEEHIRRIIIPVDVPHTQIVHTVHLRLIDPLVDARGYPAAIAVGHSIPAELVLRYSRGWNTPGHNSGQGPEELEFSYELDAHPDTWLVGGRRRAQFRAREHEPVYFPVLLIPQKAGHLPYPSIEIKSAEDQRASEQSGASPRGSGASTPPSAEVDYLNQGESILVVPNLRWTTVSLEPEGGSGGGGGGGGARLVEAQTGDGVALTQRAGCWRVAEAGSRERRSEDGAVYM